MPIYRLFRDKKQRFEVIRVVHVIHQWLLHTPHDPNPACEKWAPCSFPIQLAAQRSAGGMGIEKDLDEMFSYDTVRPTRAAVRCDGLTD